jgi:Tol biopolymer transport system component
LGEPVRLPDVINDGGSIYAPSIAADGTLFFMKPSPESGRFQLFSAKRSANGYEEPHSLPFSDGSTTDVDPAVAPDQAFMIFGSSRRAATDIDLYISHREANGWKPPVYLGEPLNSRTSDAEPRLSPDGRTLYFSSERLEPVASPIAGSNSAIVARDMGAWNNGLYNIWQADLQTIVSTSAVAPAEIASSAVETQDASGVRQAEQRWREAFVAGDASVLGALLDDEYISVSARGQARTKQEVIAAAIRYAAEQPAATASPLAPNVVVKVLGSSAVVRHTSSGDRSVDVLRFVGGRWIAVYSQHTALQPTTR